MFKTVLSRRRLNGKVGRPKAKHISRAPKSRGSLKDSEMTDASTPISWISCEACDELVAVRSDSENSERGSSFSYICRHCRWEQAHSDLIERLVQVERSNSKLIEESNIISGRLNVIEQSHLKLESLLNDIAAQFSDESFKLHSRLDNQDVKIETLQWRTSVDSDKTWPKLVHDTVPVTPVVPSKKAENVPISGEVIVQRRSKLPQFVKKTRPISVSVKSVKNVPSNCKVTKINESAKSINSSPHSVCEVTKINESAKSLISSQKESTGISFEQLTINKKKGTVLIIGDSLAREVGNHLQSQHSMFESHAFGGARIEDIAKKVEEDKEKDDSHVVVMVGTNNLKSDGTTMIMS